MAPVRFGGVHVDELGIDMGVEPKKGVENPPKWMVKIMENPIKFHDLGVPLLFGNTHIKRFGRMSALWKLNGERTPKSWVGGWFVR